jgi:hypothetical protein
LLHQTCRSRRKTIVFRLIAGRFASPAAVQDAARRLFAEGFAAPDVAMFFVDPAGRNPRTPADTTLLIVRVRHDTQQRAIDLLQQTGGTELEYATGNWIDVPWTAFDLPAPGRKSADAMRPLAETSVQTDATGNEDPGSELDEIRPADVKPASGKKPQP